MWANAQRDGRPAEYRWRPLFNAAKFGWRPLLEYRALMMPRRETRWNLLGCPQLANSSQPLLGRSSPYYEDMWRSYWCLTRFFRLSINALVAKIWPDKIVRWCQNGDFLRPVFQRAACSTFQTCILNSPSGHTLCGSMVDIQSSTAEIRRGKKKKERKRRRKIENTGQKYNVRICYAGRP